MRTQPSNGILLTLLLATLALGEEPDVRRRALEREFEAAVEAGDAAGARRIQREMEAMDLPPAPPSEAGAAPVGPAIPGPAAPADVPGPALGTEATRRPEGTRREPAPGDPLAAALAGALDANARPLVHGPREPVALPRVDGNVGIGDALPDPLSPMWWFESLLKRVVPRLAGPLKVKDAINAATTDLADGSLSQYQLDQWLVDKIEKRMPDLTDSILDLQRRQEMILGSREHRRARRDLDGEGQRLTAILARRQEELLRRFPMRNYVHTTRDGQVYDRWQHGNDVYEHLLASDREFAAAHRRALAAAGVMEKGERQWIGLERQRVGLLAERQLLRRQVLEMRGAGSRDWQNHQDSIERGFRPLPPHVRAAVGQAVTDRFVAWVLPRRIRRR